MLVRISVRAIQAEINKLFDNQGYFYFFLSRKGVSKSDWMDQFIYRL